MYSLYYSCTAVLVLVPGTYSRTAVCSLVHVGVLGVLGTFGKSQTYPGSQPSTDRSIILASWLAGSTAYESTAHPCHSARSLLSAPVSTPIRCSPPTSIFDKMTGTRDRPVRVRSKPVRYTETGVTPPIARGVKDHSKQPRKNAATGSVGDIGGPVITDVASCPTSGCFKYKSGGGWKLKNQLGTDVVRNFKRSCLDYNQKKVRLLTEVISAEGEAPAKKSKKLAPGTALGAASQGAGAGKKLGGASAAAKKKRGKKNEEGGENAEEVAASIEAGLFLDEASITLLKFLQSDSFQVMVEYKLESHLQQAREALQQAVKAAKAAGLEISDVKNIVDLTQ
jgi:hypothetical protein